MKRTRLAPPPGSSPLITTKLVGSTHDVRRLIAQGWTIVDDHGEATTDIPPNGASVDVPPNISQRIEQVLGEAPRKGRRPRIVRPATAILALFIGLSAMAQEAMSAKVYSPSEVYTLEYPIAELVTPEGYGTTIILVRARSTGITYTVPMPSNRLAEVKPGGVVEVRPLSK